MDSVFVDTSALYALMVATDAAHEPAKAILEQLASEDARLVTSSFVLQETVALLQARTGTATVRQFREGLAPLLEVVWVDASIYEAAISALLAADSRAISLTDWSSFEIMRRRRLRSAFAFDVHFRQRGFELLRDELR